MTALLTVGLAGPVQAADRTAVPGVATGLAVTGAGAAVAVRNYRRRLAR